MPIFRFHKGDYSEAMRTCVEVNSKSELIKLINEDNISIEKYAFDHRNGWDTHIVRYLNRGKYYVAGFLSGGLS
jgi:hypothetical protein